ncbi:MAG: peptidylprolyl isomerase [Planctomycetota bacterium]
MPVLRPSLLLLMVCVLQAVESRAVDQVFRYVNNDIITVMDIRERRRELMAEAQAEGRPLQHTAEEATQFFVMALEALTEEQLLLQEAQRLGIQLDDEAIASEVREKISAYGRERDLQAQADLRQHLRRREMIRAVLQLYEERSPEITPKQLRAIYAAGDYDRPSRVRAWRISLRPAREGGGAEALAQLQAAFRAAAALEHPALETVDFDQWRERYVDAGDGATAKTTVLAESLAAVAAALAGVEDPAAAAVVEQVAAAQAAIAGAQGEAAVRARLTRLREELLAHATTDERVAAFQAAADDLRGLEQAAHPPGGELGLIEPDSLGSAFAEQLQHLGAGEISPVFKSGRLLHLMLVSQREDPAERSFAEVSIELRPRVEAARRQQIKQQVVAKLRRRATIRDLVEWSEDASDVSDD